MIGWWKRWHERRRKALAAYEAQQQWERSVTHAHRPMLSGMRARATGRFGRNGEHTESGGDIIPMQIGGPVPPDTVVVDINGLDHAGAMQAIIDAVRHDSGDVHVRGEPAPCEPPPCAPEAPSWSPPDPEPCSAPDSSPSYDAPSSDCGGGGGNGD